MIHCIYYDLRDQFYFQYVLLINWNSWLQHIIHKLVKSQLLRACVSYGNSVRPGVTTRPSTESSPDQIETPGFHDSSDALNVDFNGVRFDPLGSRSPPYECIKFGYALQNAQFLLLSTNLPQIDRFAVYHNKHCWWAFRGYQHRWPWTPKYGFLVNFFGILGCNAHLDWIFAEITGDRPRQHAYDIKLMLSRISWALAQISCIQCKWNLG